MYECTDSTSSKEINDLFPFIDLSMAYLYDIVPYGKIELLEELRNRATYGCTSEVKMQ